MGLTLIERRLEDILTRVWESAIRNEAVFDGVHEIMALIPPQRCAPSEEQITEALRQPHGPTPGQRIWQRNHKTGMLESTCKCGDVLSIKEEYTYIDTGWARTSNIKGAGEAWYTHHNERMVAAIATLYAAQPTVQQAKAEAWDEAIRAMDRYLAESARSQSAYSLAGEGWKVARPTNPYRSEASHD